MNLTKDELLRNLKNVQEKYKDKIYKTFELNIYAMVSDVIDYLENEHFESSELELNSEKTRSNPPLELENQFLDGEIELMISLLKRVEGELGMDITLLIDKLIRIQNTLPKDEGVVTCVEFEID